MNKSDYWSEIDRYYQLWYEVTQLYVKWAKQQGSTYNAILVLRTILCNRENCTAKVICEKRGLPKQTVSTILKDFEDKGYITFSDYSEDKRSKVISFTEKGLAYAEKINDSLYEQDYKVVEKMGFDKIKELNEILSLYTKYYREAGEVDKGEEK